MDCLICSESDPKKVFKCQGCDSYICISCAKQYLLDPETTANKCPSYKCQCFWDDMFLSEKIGKHWVETHLRNKLKEQLFKLESQKIPAFMEQMPSKADFTRMEKRRTELSDMHTMYQKEINELRKESTALYHKAENLPLYRQWNDFRDIIKKLILNIDPECELGKMYSNCHRTCKELSTYIPEFKALWEIDNQYRIKTGLIGAKQLNLQECYTEIREISEQLQAWRIGDFRVIDTLQNNADPANIPNVDNGEPNVNNTKIQRKIKPTEKVKFVCPCPHMDEKTKEKCRGLVQADTHACRLCNKIICRKCREPIHVPTHNEAKDKGKSGKKGSPKSKGVDKGKEKDDKYDYLKPDNSEYSSDSDKDSTDNIDSSDNSDGDSVKEGLEKAEEEKELEKRIIKAKKEHKCNEDTVKTIELLKEDTKPCPQCAVPIHRIFGCNQMWCPSCKLVYNYATGEKEKGVVHNPHAVQYMRQQKGKGGVADTNVDMNNGEAVVGNCDRHLSFGQINGLDTLIGNRTEINGGLRNIIFGTMAALRACVDRLHNRSTHHKDSKLQEYMTRYLLTGEEKAKYVQHIFKDFRDSLRENIRTDLCRTYSDILNERLTAFYNELRLIFSNIVAPVNEAQIEKMFLAFDNECDNIRELMNQDLAILNFYSSTKYFIKKDWDVNHLTRY